MNKAILYFLAVAGMASTASAAGIICTYVPKEGASKESIMLIPMDDAAIVRMRFRGASPDRYFARAAKGDELIQFATRDGQNGLLKLKQVNSSRMSVVHNIGGNSYTWKKGDLVFNLNCDDH